MTNKSSVYRRLLAIFAMLSLTLLGTAVATNSAEAAPYGSFSVSVVFGTNSQGQEIVTVTISNGEPNTVYDVQIHSTPVTLGTITTDANGNGTGTFVVPAGFSGSHSIVVINTKTGQSTSTSVDVPASGGGSTPVSGGSGSSGGLPNTGAAILGVGVLALAFLAGGGALLAVGRKRGRAKQTA